MAALGRERRQQRLDVLTGAVPADQGGHGEAMAWIVQPRATCSRSRLGLEGGAANVISALRTLDEAALEADLAETPAGARDEEP